MWSAPNNLWLHFRASCRNLGATWTFPVPSSIIATLMYVAAVLEWESPQLKWRRNKARFTYLSKKLGPIKGANEVQKTKDKNFSGTQKNKLEPHSLFNQKIAFSRKTVLIEIINYNIRVKGLIQQWSSFEELLFFWHH